MSNSLERAQARKDGKLATRMARAGVVTATLADGTKVTGEIVSARLRYLAEMVRAQAEKRIFEVWAAQAVLDLPKSPSHAYVAMLATYDSLIWPPENFHASQRVLRLAEELAGRTLRSAGRSLSILEALVNFEPLPADITETEQRNLWRAVKNYRDDHGSDPASVYDLIACPDFSAGFYNCPLDAADNQQVKLEDDQLSILLPACEFPGKADWAWHTLTLKIPAFAESKYPGAKVRKPSLRLTPEELYFLVPLDIELPELHKDLMERQAGEEKILGVDWGERRLATAALVARDESGQVYTTGRPFYFDAGDLQGKQARRRAEAEHLAKEIERMEKEEREARKSAPARVAKIAVLKRERDLLWRRISQCNRQLEYAAANWVVAIALAEGADTISREDIDSLEARGLGSKVNARVSNQVRGGVYKRIDEKAQLASLAVVAVVPRGTSSFCSRCQRKSVFQQAPDRKYGRKNPATGNQAAHQNWLVCEDCRSSDRDHSSGEAIGARGFDAPLAKRNSRNKPVAGPASRRPIKHRPERPDPSTEAQQARKLAQAIPFPTCEQTQHAPRSCRTVSPRRVDRGSALVARPPERRTLTNLESSEVSPPRVLDGLAGGYWRRITFSRPRALVIPPGTVLTQGM